MRFGTMSENQGKEATALREERVGPPLWHALLYAFFVYVFVTGGSSQLRGWTDAVAELISLPILAYGLWRLVGLPFSWVRTLGLVAMAAVACLPWLQLIPLGKSLWMFAPAREALAQDLLIVGVSEHATSWSLTHLATLKAGLAMLPAVALFSAVLGEDSRTQRRLLILCVLLPIASLILGFLQLGAPQDSLLNPYPQWAPSMAGVFANPNHQGTAMLVGLGVCLAFAIGAFVGHATGPAHGIQRRTPWPAMIAGTTLLLGLPLTNSRAAVVIGVLLLTAAPLAMAAAALRRKGQARRGVIALLVVAALAALGLSAAMGWMKVDELEELRGVLRRATFELASAHLPWGSGVGSYVPVFQQALPEALLLPKFANAAHNDVAQIWLEAGWLGVFAGCICAFALIFASIFHLRTGAGDHRLVWSAILGLFAFVVHAGADYALRTPTLMAVAAVLAAVFFSQCARRVCWPNSV